MKILSLLAFFTLAFSFGPQQLNAQLTTYGFESGTVGNATSTYIGYRAGQQITTGVRNTFLGYVSGTSTTSGFGNTFLGSQTGTSNVTGAGNLFVGRLAGQLNSTGSNNTYMGHQAGQENATGSGNIFIGNRAGRWKVGINNTLIIDNSHTNTPLIYGDFGANKVGINTANTPSTIGGINISSYSLFVKGGILTDEVRVEIGWADYVFNKDYPLLSLHQVEKYIEENGHLPNVPSAETVEAQGVALGDMTRLQQEKIEELTLYIIELNKRIENLEGKLGN